MANPKQGARGRRSAPGKRRKSAGRSLTVGTRQASAGVRMADGRAGEPEHVPSATAVAAEALRTGIIPHAIARRADDLAIPGEAEAMRVGDPDDGTMDNEYVGEDTPGGSTPTPDQGNVDDIGRVYGVQDEDSGELRTSSELMDGRDRRRRGGDAKRGL
jgi:hypothetical protein